ncbi:MAG: 16S rRNA processing protein RimM [Prevotella sp.]|nr:16S rRNA processing protein RimM [Prevotella sp.]
MIKQEDVYKIGRLGKPHGVRGELSFMFSDDVFDRVDADYLIVETEGILVPFFIEEYRFRSGETALLKLEGISTVERARELTNSDVFFPRRLAQNDDEEMTWAQIVGFRLVDEQLGKVVGSISSVDDSTENVLFDVATPDGKNLLIPAAEDWISDVDTEKREIRMRLPEGLLDL